MPEDDMIMPKCAVYILNGCDLNEVVTQAKTYLYTID
jgi:hypothetical protein